MFKLTGGPEEAAAQLCAHLGLDKLHPHNREKELEKMNVELIRTLEKMKEEREDIFEKNSALEDACGESSYQIGPKARGSRFYREGPASSSR